MSLLHSSDKCQTKISEDEKRQHLPHAQRRNARRENRGNVRRSHSDKARKNWYTPIKSCWHWGTHIYQHVIRSLQIKEVTWIYFYIDFYHRFSQLSNIPLQVFSTTLDDRHKVPCRTNNFPKIVIHIKTQLVLETCWRHIYITSTGKIHKPPHMSHQSHFETEILELLALLHLNLRA